MGTMKTCDGCMEPANAVSTIGTIDPLEYCDACAETVNRFVQARDDLHEAIATKWEVEFEKLKLKAMKKNPDLRLPDV